MQPLAYEGASYHQLAVLNQKGLQSQQSDSDIIVPCVGHMHGRWRSSSNASGATVACDDGCDMLLGGQLANLRRFSRRALTSLILFLVLL